MGRDLRFFSRQCAAFAAAALILGAVAFRPTFAAEGLKPGPGATLTAARCSVCHELGHITRSNLSREQWEDTLALMMKRGLVVTPEERAQLLDYLTQHYGPTTSGSDASGSDASGSGAANK